MHRRISLLAILYLSACSADVTNPPKQQAPTPPHAISVFAGDRSTCVLTSGGAVECWGSNALGTLGLGTTDLNAHGTPDTVVGGHSFGALSGAASFVCALTTQGQPWCWGSALTSGSVSPRDSVPVAFAGAPAMSSISVGWGHACGLTVAGAAYCWGHNQEGQLGTGDTVDRGTPTPVLGGSTWRAISAGVDNTCAVSTTGQANCWGDTNYVDGAIYGEIETAPGAPITSPVRFASLHSGADYQCGLTSGGAAYCWGLNYASALGDSTMTFQPVPVAVVGGITFATIAISGENSIVPTTCGLSTQGAAYCWGNQSYEQLGTSAAQLNTCAITPQFSVPCSPVPVSVAGGLTFTAIAVGNTHVCAVTAGGAVYCWGMNDQGQLGTATSTPSASSPIRVSGFGTQ
jgi:alpha-tubulin suppressor-like RCC1 family protein